LGSRLRELRKKKNLTQKELGKIFKVSESTIGMYERNEREPSYDLIRQFSDFFGVSIDYLLGRDNAKKSSDVLSPKEEKDIAKELEKIMNQLESNDTIAFYGEIMDAETRELVKAALETSFRIARRIAKEKFTPKKYRREPPDS